MLATGSLQDAIQCCGDRASSVIGDDWSLHGGVRCTLCQRVINAPTNGVTADHTRRLLSPPAISLSSGGFSPKIWRCCAAPQIPLNRMALTYTVVSPIKRTLTSVWCTLISTCWAKRYGCRTTPAPGQNRHFLSLSPCPFTHTLIILTAGFFSVNAVYIHVVSEAFSA